MPVHPPFADLALARRLEFTEGNGNAAFIDARVRHDPAGGAARITVGGTLAMFDGPGSPVTQTFGLGIAEPATLAGLDELEQFFKSRGSDVFHEVSPLAGVDLPGTLAKRGYRPIELSSVLYQPIDGWKARAANPALRVRAVDKSEADLYARLGARGWSESPEVQPFIEGFARISLECATCFVAESGGTPIAAGAVFLHEGVAAGRRQHGARRAAARRATGTARHPVALRGIQGLRSGHDVCGARQRVAAQRRAQRLPDRVPAYEVAVVGVRRLDTCCSSGLERLV